jgi:hypothetical protein
VTTVTDAPSSATASQQRGASLRVALPLARAEFKQLMVQPLLGVGIGLTFFIVGVSMGRGGSDLRREGALFGLLVWPLAGMTLVAANRMTSRARRHRTTELLDTLPAAPEARTLGYMLALAAPVVYASALCVVFIVLPRVFGGVSWPPVSEIAIGLILVACAGVVGILLERLARRSMLAPLVVIGIGFLEGEMASDRHSRALQVLAPWQPQPGTPPELWVRPSAWHVLYLLGIMTLLGVAAIAVHRRTRRVAAVAAAALIATVTAGLVQQSFPIDSQLRRSTTFLAHPERVQRCLVDDGVQYCFYPAYEYMLAQWQRPVSGVLHRTPPAVRVRTLRFTQRLRGDHFQFLEREQLAALPFAVPPDGLYVYPDDGAVHADFDWCPVRERFACETPLAIKVASWAVGLPISNERTRGPAAEESITTSYDSSGQARAVVALWLAGGATDATAGGMRPVLLDARPGNDPECGFKCETGGPVHVTTCDDAHESYVRFALADLGYARMLLSRPAAEVGRTLASNWERLVDPRTTTAELATLFRLPEPPAELQAPPFISAC